MARLEAVAKGLYYPTPTSVAELIAGAVKVGRSFGAILDPCCGMGDAAALLALRWGIVAHGVELDRDRASAAADVLTIARRASYHQIRLPKNTGYGALLLNPPYDGDTRDEDPNGHRPQRQEVVFLRAALEWLLPEGLLVYIVPRKIIERRDVRDLLQAHFRRVEAYAFPEGEVEAYDQVVVFARRTDSRWPSYIGALDKDLPVLGPDTSYDEGEEITLPGLPPNLILSKLVPEDICPTEDGGTYGSSQWRAWTGDADERETQPLVQPRPGHQAMLLAAGYLDGLELDGCLVKGGSNKVVDVSAVGEDTTVERERIASYLSTLNLTSGELESWRVDQDAEKTIQWFGQYGPALANAILHAHTPQVTPEVLDRYNLDGLTAPGVLPGRTEPEILETQREAAIAVVHRWQTHKSVIVCGEMGTGKTTMATLACEVAMKHRGKFVIICPTHLVAKWIREIKVITKGAARAVTAKKLSEVDAFFKDPKLRYLVLSKETAKLGSRWIPSYSIRKTLAQRYVDGKTVRVVEDAIQCPQCGNLPRTDGGYLMSPEGFDTKTKQSCSECKGALWTIAPLNGRGTRRWPLARYIAHRYPQCYSLVVDEAHQHAKGETDQARAVHVLITAARKVVAMTGTLYGGRASSIFHLLYRLDPGFRQTYKHTDCATFVQHMGLFETVYEEDERTRSYGGRTGRTGGRVREIPGMHPAMVPLLLPYTVFVKLSDLGLDLPPYRETVELVTPDPDVHKAATHLASEVKGVLREYPEVLGAYLQACLGYPDCPEQPEKIMAPAKRGKPEMEVASAPAFPTQLWPKDQRLVDICRREHAAGRRVLVFYTQTGRRDARPRCRAALEAAGLKVVTLEASVDPSKREAWLEARQAEGFDVMFTNGRLVETGLDLLFAKTIVQYGTEYSISTLRQSVRRSWRLGQVDPVEVIFLGYAGGMQEIALDLIAKKMRAAELVDGDEAGGLSQHDVAGGNFLLELAHACLQEADAA